MSNYIDDLADAIRAQVPSDDLPHENTRVLFRLYAVLALAKGMDTTAMDVHNAWVAWMLSSDAHHDALVPYEELDAQVAKQDEPFVRAVHVVSQVLADRAAQ